MDSVWRRYRDLSAKPNRKNFWDPDCTCPYSPYGDVAGLYHLMMWQYSDMADIGSLMLGESDIDKCDWVAYNRRTRGPIQGHHVLLAG
jgi:hypothetical protein